MSTVRPFVPFRSRSPARTGLLVQGRAASRREPLGCHLVQHSAILIVDRTPWLRQKATLTEATLGLRSTRRKPAAGLESLADPHRQGPLCLVRAPFALPFAPFGGPWVRGRRPFRRGPRAQRNKLLAPISWGCPEKTHEQLWHRRHDFDTHHGPQTGPQGGPATPRRDPRATHAWRSHGASVAPSRPSLGSAGGDSPDADPVPWRSSSKPARDLN
jgi:hypothetical protein